MRIIGRDIFLWWLMEGRVEWPGSRANAIRVIVMPEGALGARSGQFAEVGLLGLETWDLSSESRVPQL